MLRKRGSYNQPSYRDPNDRRLVQIIRHVSHKMADSVNILGIPFDGGVLGRKGAAEGPAGIRQAMSGFSNYNPEMKLGLQGARVYDLGDLLVDPTDIIKAHRQIESEVGIDLDSSSLLVLLGGDNSISLPSLRAYAEKFGSIGLVVIDSHFDLRGTIGGRPSSGSSYGLAIKSVRGLDPHRVAEIGIHGFLNSEAYAKKAERLGIRVYTAADVRKHGATSIAAEAYAVAHKGSRAVYMSVDLDAVDLAQVSGVSAPSVGGISSSELLEVVYHVSSRDDVRCADLVELAPSLDPTGRSKIVAATALAYMIGGFVSRRA